MTSIFVDKAGQPHKKYYIEKNLESVVCARGKVFGQAFFKKLVRVWEQSSQGLSTLGSVFLKWSGGTFHK